MHFKTNTQTEESHVKYHQTCSGRIPEKTSSQKAAEQNHDQRSDHRLWHQPYGFLLSFKDIYDLVEWACLEESRKALQGKKTYDTWQEGLLQIFEAVYENKPFIINAYNAISREQIENFSSS